MRGVQGHQADQPGHKTSSGKRNDPTHEDVQELLPVDSTKIKVHERDTHGRTNKTLRGRHRQAKLRGEKNGDSGAKLNGEAASRAHLCDLVPDSPHNSVPPNPEPETEQETSNDEEPDRSSGSGVDLARKVGLVDSSPRPDGVGNIIAAMSNRHHHGRDDLAVGEHVFNSHIVVLGLSMDGA